MALISEGINQESKEKMKELIIQKKEMAAQIRKNIANYAKEIQNEIDSLTPFWLNSYIDKMQQEHIELVKLETEIDLLTIYSATKEQEN